MQRVYLILLCDLIMSVDLILFRNMGYKGCNVIVCDMVSSRSLIMFESINDV